MTIVWTADDVRFLKSLQIAPGPEPFMRGERFTGEVTTVPEDHNLRRELEPAYVRAMVDPNSDRNGAGHPELSMPYYNISPIMVRSKALTLALAAHKRGEHCKCGASVPHFGCYV